jgi:type I restriction enzyme S subunit
MIDWQTVPIGELFRLKQGTYLKPAEMAEEQTDAFPYPVYGANGIIGYSNRKMYQNRTTLISCRGANCGVVHYTVPNVWISNNSIACIPSTEIDPTFYYYVCLNTDFADVITGSAQPQITITNLSSKHFIRPPLPIQRRIAGILSAYDELIENCQRRLKILEAMARALYREWFVHFRFPGHESVPRVSSPLGDIPQGWEVKKLATVADVNRAQINARTAPEELRYIDISSVSPGQINSITTYAFADAPGRARRLVQHGDVLWSCVRPNRRSHAQVMHPEPNTIASTGFAVLTATKVPFTFLYFATTTDDFVAFLTNNATGAAYPAVSGATFENADQLIPPAPLLRKFGDATIPMAEQIHTLQRKIQNLRRTRDLLLPRLLSGKIGCEGSVP